MCRLLNPKCQSTFTTRCENHCAAETEDPRLQQRDGRNPQRTRQEVTSNCCCRCRCAGCVYFVCFMCVHGAHRLFNWVCSKCDFDALLKSSCVKEVKKTKQTTLLTDSRQRHRGFPSVPAGFRQPWGKTTCQVCGRHLHGITAIVQKHRSWPMVCYDMRKFRAAAGFHPPGVPDVDVCVH